MEHTLAKKRISGGLAVLICLGILVSINVVLGAFRLRADLTEDKLYTLSDGTRELLAGLDRDVVLKFYFSKSSDRVPIPLKQFAQRVTELLEEYQTHSDGRVTLETFDPRPDSDEEEWAQRYGVSAQSLGGLGGLGVGPNVYLGLVGVSGAKEAVIPVISPNQEPQLEYLVSRLVYEVTQSGKKVVGVMSPLPVNGSTPPNPYQPGGGSPPWLAINELKRTHEVREIGVDVDAIPGDVQTLVVIQPTGLSDQALFAIDQFVLRGGRLMAFVDPLCIAERELGGQAPYQQQPDLAPFNKLLGAWGLSVDTGNVVGDVQYASHVRNAQGGTARNITWLSLRKAAIESDEVATTGLDNLLLCNAGYFSGEPAEGLTKTTLLASSTQAGTVNAMQAAYSPDGGLGALVRKDQALDLALRVQGRFKTAFPDGKPAAEPEGDDAAPASPDALKESSGDGVVLLIGDTDMIYDRFCVRGQAFFGQTIYEPINDNLAFFMNMVEQVSGSEVLIGLRSRGTFNRPFTRVMALEQKAQERGRQEEAELQAKLQQAQARLNELQARKDQNQRSILTPEQQDEIRRFRREQFETQKALKEVRKNLRREIEQLGLRLKTINLALVPLGVAIFGVVRGLKRRRN